MEKNDRQSFTRVAFETPRVSEYFNARELTMLTGQPEDNFAAVLQKELADNSLDSAESLGVAPEVFFETSEVDGMLHICVTDNGPGIPPDVVEKVLDFNVRVSDKAAYPSPSRGAQGNALKTIVGIPHALGGSEPLLIEAAGVRHEIRAWLDPANELRIIHNKLESCRKAGTTVAVIIPAEDQAYHPVWWARAISMFNPHALVRIRVPEGIYNHAQNDSPIFDETYNPLVQFPNEWNKWLPSDSIPAHWYSEESFARLIFLHLANSRNNGRPDPGLGEFVRQFRGLSSTAKAKAIAQMLPKINRLSDFESGQAEIGLLLEAMQESSNPVPAKALGLIGEDQFYNRFDELYGVERFWYSKQLGETNGLPFALEVALAHTEKQAERHYFGLNFAPTFGDPLSGTWIQLEDELIGRSLLSLLDAAYVRDFRSVFAFHLTSPALNFRDRGKSTITVGEELLGSLKKALWPVLKVAFKEGKARRKSRAKVEHAEEQLQRSTEISVKDAVFGVLEEGWAQASDAGQFPVSARMLYYAVRRLIQRSTTKELDFNYFSQTLLTEWKEIHGPLNGLYFDPRGVLYEPHDGETVSLGTREVAAYHFPEHVFDKILYVEKKGLMPILRAAQIGERFDMAIIAGEGYATEAARMLFARAQKGQNHYQLFVLHDADFSGYNIARTLAEETRRMPGYSVQVHDLGLHLEEGFALGLQSEKFLRRKALPANLNLTDVERRYFEGEFRGRDQWECERIELNAFTAPGLIAYLERKLSDVGATAKVIPPSEFLDLYSRRVFEKKLDSWVNERASNLMALDEIKVAISRDFDSKIRVSTPETISSAFATDPLPCWRSVVDEETDSKIMEFEDNLTNALQEGLYQNASRMLKSRKR